jgi:hypothetical protein
MSLSLKLGAFFVLVCKCSVARASGDASATLGNMTRPAQVESSSEEETVESVPEGDFIAIDSSDAIETAEDLTETPVPVENGTPPSLSSANLRGSLISGTSTSEGEVMADTPDEDDVADNTSTVAAKDEPSQKKGMTAMMASGWGHGSPGETCCMCSKRWGFSTILYAAGDYSHRYGTHSANWYCSQVCERQCRRKGGHMFGCYDEAHLIQMDMRFGHNPQYTILHEEHFGNIC